MDIAALMKSIPPMLHNNYPQYQRMAYKFYQDYLKYKEEYSRLLDKYGQFDVLAHTPEGQIRYQELIEERQTYCVATLVFEAFACEAYMNYLCEITFGKETFQKMDNNKFKLAYKTSSTTGKLDYFCEYNQLGKLDINSQIQQKVKTLMKARDDLAHNKLREVRVDMEPEEFLYALWNMGVNGNSIYSILDNSIGVCQELIDEITRIIQQKFLTSQNPPPSPREEAKT